MNIKKISWLGGVEIALGKKERGKGSLRCCLLYNNNLPTLHLVLPPGTAWDCVPTHSLCSFSQSSYFGVAESGAILGITTPGSTRAAARSVPGSLPCLGCVGVRGELPAAKHCGVQPPWLPASAAARHSLLHSGL